MTTKINLEQVQASVLRFVAWLDNYGETSYDHQTFFASDLGRWAKRLYYKKPLLGAIAVAPMIFSEAFVPSARKLFWKRQRLPIADAHYAMGFAFLAQVLDEEKYYRRAVHFVEVLEQTRCPGFKSHAWGYPFTWETRFGAMQAGTPLITTVPYAYEAFREVYLIDHDPRWREAMLSTARHVYEDYKDFATSERAASCSYYPDYEHGVINASAYRAFTLTQAAIDFSDDRYLKVADRNLNFVFETQNADGSWFYSTEGKRNFVDHFHTCFVLKALAKIEALTHNPECAKVIARGVDYYVKNLFDEEGWPKPFSRRPRLTVYRREGYDYAECINLAVLLAGRFPALDEILARVSKLEGWQKRDGSFRSRQLFLGWDNVPMHRWAQSQMFRSLCFLLYRNHPRSQQKFMPDQKETLQAK
jgi:hypothetical protein